MSSFISCVSCGSEFFFNEVEFKESENLNEHTKIHWIECPVCKEKIIVDI